MTTKEAIKIARKAPRTNMSTAEHQAINQVCNFAERFEGAVEVEFDAMIFEMNRTDVIKFHHPLRSRYRLYAIPKEDAISQTNQPDWDWDIRYWVYSPEYVYDKHNNKRLISDVRAELDNQIYVTPKQKQ